MAFGKGQAYWRLGRMDCKGYVFNGRPGIEFELVIPQSAGTAPHRTNWRPRQILHDENTTYVPQL